MTSIHEKIAKALGWTVKEAQSFSLPTLRELVKGTNPVLAQEIAEYMKTGAYIKQG